MPETFIQYILPFMGLAACFFYFLLRMHWEGGPVGLFVIFMSIGFGPSFLYAIIENDSNANLFLLSLVAALLVMGIVWWKLYRKK